MKKISLLAGLLIITMGLTACGNRNYNMSFEEAIDAVSKSNSQINELIQNTEYFQERFGLSTSITTGDTKLNLELSFDSRKNTHDSQSDSNISLNVNISSEGENLAANGLITTKLLPDTLYLNLTNLESTGNDELAMIPVLADGLKSQRFSVPLSGIEFMSGFISYAQNLKDSELNIENLYINEGLIAYSGQYSKYNGYNAWKFSINSERLLSFVNEYMNSMYSAMPEFESTTGLNLESSINNFEGYLIILGKDNIATVIENMDINVEEAAINTTCINSKDELILNMNSQGNNILNLSATKQGKKYNVSLNLANILNIHGTVIPQVAKSNLDLSFDLFINVNGTNQQIENISIPLQGKRSFNQIPAFTIEAPVESINLNDLLGSYLGAGILDDYEAEDYPEDENYDITSYENIEFLEENITE